MKGAIFNEVLQKVSDVMEIGKDEILHCNKEECVDARYILVGVLSEKLTDSNIAMLTGLKRQTVNFIRNNLSERIKRSWLVRCGIEEVKRADFKLPFL